MLTIMILLDDWLVGTYMKQAWPSTINSLLCIWIIYIIFFYGSILFFIYVICSFYEVDGSPTEYFWSIDRKIQFGMFEECFKSLMDDFMTWRQKKNEITRLGSHAWVHPILQNQQSFPIAIFFLSFFLIFNFKAWSNKKKKRIFIVIFHRATWNTRKTRELDFGVQTNQAELIEIGQDIRFNCLIKTQSHTLVYVRERRTLIYLSLDDMKIARIQLGRVLWQQMNKAMMINWLIKLGWNWENSIFRNKRNCRWILKVYCLIEFCIMVL